MWTYLSIKVLISGITIAVIDQNDQDILLEIIFPQSLMTSRSINNLHQISLFHGHISWYDELSNL